MYHGEGGGVKGGDPSWPPEWEKEVARDRRGGFWGLWWGFMVGGHQCRPPQHGSTSWRPLSGRKREGRRREGNGSIAVEAHRGQACLNSRCRHLAACCGKSGVGTSWGPSESISRTTNTTNTICFAASLSRAFWDGVRVLATSGGRHRD